MRVIYPAALLLAVCAFYGFGSVSAFADSSPSPSPANSAVAQYVETIPTARGAPDTGNGHVLPAKTRQKIRSTGGKNSGLLEKVASSPSYGAPDATTTSATTTTQAQPAPTTTTTPVTTAASTPAPPPTTTRAVTTPPAPVRPKHVHKATAPNRSSVAVAAGSGSSSDSDPSGISGSLIVLLAAMGAALVAALAFAIRARGNRRA